MARASHSRSYRPDIDGLRAVAILAVIGFHAFTPFLPGGFVGVDIFFVISGYLITGNLLGMLRSDRFNVAGFYARRIRRIFPALAVVLLASAAIGWVLLTPIEYANLGKHIAGAAAFGSNFLLWREAGYFDAVSRSKPLLHVWSLSIEEQFYLVWPVFLWLLWRRRLSPVWGLALLSLSSFILNVVLTARYPIAAFYFPLARAWELGAGGLLAALPPGAVQWSHSEGRRGALSIVGLVAIGAAILTFDARSPFPGWRAVLPVGGTALVILAGPDAAPNRELLQRRAAVGIGVISYPLYLWHWLLLSFTFTVTSGDASPTLRVAIVTLSLILAVLTYFLIERPIRSERISPARVGALSASLAIAAAFGAAIYLTRGVPVRFPAPVRELLTSTYDFRSDAQIGRCWMDYDSAPDSRDPGCFVTRPDRPAVLLWGDSHAGRLYPGIDQVYGDTLSIEDVVRTSCPPVLPPPPDDGCVRANRYVLSVVERQKPDVVILFAVWPLYAAVVPHELPQLANLILGAGARRVMVLGPAPMWKTALPTLVFKAWTMSGRQTIPRRQTLGLDARSLDSDRMMRRLPWASGVVYVSLIEILCNEEGCLTLVPGSDRDLMTWDYGHLTTAGAAYIARHLDRALTAR